MALMSEPVTSLQDDTRKQLGAFCVPGAKASIRSASAYRAAAAAARRACAGKRWRCSRMSA